MGEAAEELAELQREIETLLARLAEAERRWQHLIVPTDPENRCSATNLVHYWAMRQVDLRDLQYRLACFGLSSLGRSEAHVQATLHRVAAAIAAMRGRGWNPPTTPRSRSPTVRACSTATPPPCWGPHRRTGPPGSW